MAQVSNKGGFVSKHERVQVDPVKPYEPVSLDQANQTHQSQYTALAMGGPAAFLDEAKKAGQLGIAKDAGDALAKQAAYYHEALGGDEKAGLSRTRRLAVPDGLAAKDFHEHEKAKGIESGRYTGEELMIGSWSGAQPIMAGSPLLFEGDFNAKDLKNGVKAGERAVAKSAVTKNNGIYVTAEFPVGDGTRATTREIRMATPKEAFAARKEAAADRKNIKEGKKIDGGPRISSKVAMAVRNEALPYVLEPSATDPSWGRKLETKHNNNMRVGQVLAVVSNTTDLTHLNTMAVQSDGAVVLHSTTGVGGPKEIAEKMLTNEVEKSKAEDYTAPDFAAGQQKIVSRAGFTSKHERAAVVQTAAYEPLSADAANQIHQKQVDTFDDDPTAFLKEVKEGGRLGIAKDAGDALAKQAAYYHEAVGGDEKVGQSQTRRLAVPDGLAAKDFHEHEKAKGIESGRYTGDELMIGSWSGAQPIMAGSPLLFEGDFNAKDLKNGVKAGERAVAKSAVTKNNGIYVTAEFPVGDGTRATTREIRMATPKEAFAARKEAAADRKNIKEGKKIDGGPRISSKVAMAVRNEALPYVLEPSAADPTWAKKLETDHNKNLRVDQVLAVVSNATDVTHLEVIAGQSKGPIVLQSTTGVGGPDELGKKMVDNEASRQPTVARESDDAAIANQFAAEMASAKVAEQHHAAKDVDVNEQLATPPQTPQKTKEGPNTDRAGGGPVKRLGKNGITKPTAARDSGAAARAEMLKNLGQTEHSKVQGHGM